MTEGIVIALITLVGTLIGVFASARSTQNKLSQQLELHQAVTDEKIVHLTEEVRRHNAFAERIPQLEAKQAVMEEKLRTLEKEAG